jgi:hypothetical protein
MTESDEAQEGPEAVHHRTLDEAFAEGPLPGFAAGDAAAERGEDESTFVGGEEEEERRAEGNIAGEVSWPGE